MQSSALQLDLPERRAASKWPWIVAALAGAGALLGTLRLADTIPTRLGVEARQVVAGEPGVRVAVDGRDVELSGTLTPAADRDRLVSRVASVDGVRIVLDGLGVFDPEAQARADRAAFGDALGLIDAAAFTFDPNSVNLSPTSRPALESLLELLRAYPDFRVRIAGHTDNTGRPEVNLRLSRERAAAVAAALVARGIDASRVIAQGYGATQPIADNATADGRARNRRIEVRYVD